MSTTLGPIPAKRLPNPRFKDVARWVQTFIIGFMWSWDSWSSSVLGFGIYIRSAFYLVFMELTVFSYLYAFFIIGLWGSSTFLCCIWRMSRCLSFCFSIFRSFTEISIYLLLGFWSIILSGNVVANYVMLHAGTRLVLMFCQIFWTCTCINVCLFEMFRPVLSRRQRVMSTSLVGRENDD
jgi:hypothetical protein